MDKESIAGIRADTPYCEDKIFLNSAGASLMPRSVVKAVQEYVLKEERLGGYRVADTHQDEIQAFYQNAAKLINAKARNIGFTHDATVAYSRALSSIPFKPHDFIVTTDNDYASNHIRFLSLQKRLDINIVRIQNLENGDLDLDHLETLIKQHKPKLVAVTHVPNHTGLVQNIEGVGKVCREYEILYLVDACQSLGQRVVDVRKVHCDFLCATGRKFLRGPRGTGFLYVSDRVLDRNLYPLFIDGRGAIWTAENAFEADETAKRFETWETPYSLLMGLKEAMRYALDIGIDEIEKHNAGLMAEFRDKLSAVPQIKILDHGSTLSNILTWRKAKKTLKQTTALLDKHDIYYSVSTRQWGLIDFDKKGIEWAIRFSPHYFNTPEEFDRTAQVLDDL